MFSLNNRDNLIPYFFQACGIMVYLRKSDDDIYDQVYRWSSFIGRGVSCSLFCLVFIYAGEVFPTTLRNSGVGMSSMAGRVGGMLAPQENVRKK
jgi:hypothetical protein